MKKLVIIIVSIFLLNSCSNIYNNKSSIEISTTMHSLAGGSRALTTSEITQIELWISQPEVDYEFAKALAEAKGKVVETQFYDSESDQDYAALDSDSELVRYITSLNSDNITFDLTTNIEKTFTLRVTFSSGQVYMGNTTRTVSIYSNIVNIDIYETSESEAIQYFTDLNDYINENY